MLPTRDMTPHVPITVQEIVEDVHRAVEIGISMVHLHARDETTGAPTYAAEVYASIIAGIRAFSPDLVICVSLSGRDFKTFQQRSEVLQLDGAVKPDMGSLTLSSLNFNRQASVNEPDMIKDLATEMQRFSILPELETFDLGMINYAHYLVKKGFLTPPHYINLIVGNIAGAQADMMHLGVMIRDLPNHAYWSIGGVGDAQLPVNIMAIAAGGGVRVGLEDNIWYDAGRTRLAKNSDYLRRIHNIIEASERQYMPSAELRRTLQLLPGHGLYGRGIKGH